MAIRQALLECLPFFTDFRKRYPNLKEMGSGGTTLFVGVKVRFDPDPLGPEYV
jgi:hypothetical protein